MATHTLSVSISKRPYDKPVHFKNDGERFSEEKTLKLNINSTYFVNLFIKPSVSIKIVEIFGNRVEFDELQGDKGRFYRAEASTNNLSKTPKTTREQLPISVQLSDLGEVTFSVQVKLYAEHENHHCCWGVPLTSIDVSFHREDSSNKINEILFR